MSSTKLDLNKVSAAGLLITLGIIFGDIGTSPLYVLKEIVGESVITADVVLGAISCIFWTLTLQTTVKYVIFTLRADNKGEGGIFALYALLRHMNKKWLIFIAIIGGSTLLADGFITPPISVATAIEGLRAINPEIKTIPIVIAIIFALFFVQQFGTSLIGKFFGPVMLLWFLMLGTLGVISISTSTEVLKSLNPYYAYSLLTAHPEGFWLLGSVFLCTTGAEALYSDLGHCGKGNIRFSWIFVKSLLVINYFGQGAWLLNHQGELLEGRNPFFALMPEWFLLIGIIIAALATIVASQALISGSFTLINEAMRLNFWPKVKVQYPTEHRGQLYIPSLNWILCFGCIGIVLFFKESSNMGAAYGLSIVITMIMTTILLVNFLIMKRFNSVFVTTLLVLYITIESAFLIANLSKFQHGGYVTIIMASILITVMFVWFRSKQIVEGFLKFFKLKNYLDLILEISEDKTLEKFATHLVYLTEAEDHNEIEEKIMYSILRKSPKRADVYWFLHINIVDVPYLNEYKVTQLVPNKIIRVDFNLGFRELPRINILFRGVVTNLSNNHEIDILSRYQSLHKHHIVGDFRFVVMKKFLSDENELSLFNKSMLKAYFFLKKMSISEERAFGLDTSNIAIELYPLIVSQAKDLHLKRRE